MEADRSTARSVARLLSGYLCGTHSGLHMLGRSSAIGAARVLDAHRLVASDGGGSKSSESTALGERRWEPSGDSVELRDALCAALPADADVELVVFGSQARGGTTGFSDLDAILVIPDGIAADPRSLRALRRHVLAAQRVVLAYQPMQHHGFEVVTPRLLDEAALALALPVEAVGESRSLFGRPVEACFTPVADPAAAFQRLASQLVRIRSWPRHPWKLHRLVAMFELAPTLYLQSTGRPSAKWLSFSSVRAEFPSLWRPYEVLDELRREWPRVRRPGLELAVKMFRNPWDAVAAWRRLPARSPRAVALLTEECLSDLIELTRQMLRNVK